MGMSIAEPIQTLEYLRDSGVFPFSTVEEVLYTVESIDVAIETMRKYQKIEEIMHKVYTSDNADVCLVQRLAEIREVMEGENE